MNRRWCATVLGALGISVAGCADSGGDAAVETGDARVATTGASTPSGSPSIPENEGTIAVPGGNVWYRVAGSGDGVPILFLHGGPGAGTRTLEPMWALGDERSVVMYDQLGAGRSEKPSDTSLWTIERHIAELDAVRDALGLEQVHIMGHSWGAMLLIEYLQTNPTGVRSATFASPLFSTARWIADAKQRVTELPADVQVVIETHEAAGTTDSPEYQEAVLEFYRRFLARSDPWPSSMDLTMQEFGVEVYGYMWGPSEFTATGTLEDWDRMDALPQLALPTLFTVGEFDETFPETVEDYASRVAGARFAILEGAGHMTFVDAPEENVRIMREFMNDVEGR